MSSLGSLNICRVTLFLAHLEQLSASKLSHPPPFVLCVGAIHRAMEIFQFFLSPACPRNLLAITAFTWQGPFDTACWWQLPPGGFSCFRNKVTVICFDFRWLPLLLLKLFQDFWRCLFLLVPSWQFSFLTMGAVIYNQAMCSKIKSEVVITLPSAECHTLSPYEIYRSSMEWLLFAFNKSSVHTPMKYFSLETRGQFWTTLSISQNQGFSKCYLALVTFLMG